MADGVARPEVFRAIRPNGAGKDWWPMEKRHRMLSLVAALAAILALVFASGNVLADDGPPQATPVAPAPVVSNVQVTCNATGVASVSFNYDFPDDTDVIVALVDASNNFEHGITNSGLFTMAAGAGTESLQLNVGSYDTVKAEVGYSDQGLVADSAAVSGCVATDNTGNGSTGNGSAGNGSGNGSGGNESGNGSTGNGSTGNGGNESSGNGSTGNGGNSTGNGSAGNGSTGNGSGNGSGGNESAGNGSTGNGSTGNSSGNSTGGNGSTGNGGNQSSGNAGGGTVDSGNGSGNGGTSVEPVVTPATTNAGLPNTGSGPMSGTGSNGPVFMMAIFGIMALLALGHFFRRRADEA